MTNSIISIDLEKCYSRCNFKYFNNTLPPSYFIKIRWNPLLKNNAGMCIKNYKETMIEINPIYIIIS